MLWGRVIGRRRSSDDGVVDGAGGMEVCVIEDTAGGWLVAALVHAGDAVVPAEAVLVQ